MNVSFHGLRPSEQTIFYSSTLTEAKHYWQERLRESRDCCLTLEGVISNSAALVALFAILPPHYRLDFSRCSFTDSAFDTLLQFSEKTRGEWVLPWLPAGQRGKMITFNSFFLTRLTLHPPERVGAEEIQELIAFIKSFYATQPPFLLDLSQWPLSRVQQQELYDFRGRGLQLVPQDQILRSPPFEDKFLCTFELLTNRNASSAEWQNLIKTNGADVRVLEVNNTATQVVVPCEGPIIALSEAIHTDIETLDLTGLLFSDQAWKAVIERFKRHPISMISLDIVTVPQLRALFAAWPEKNLAVLDLSRSKNVRTNEAEKNALVSLLVEYLPKFTKLTDLFLYNWNLKSSDLSQLSHVKFEETPIEEKALLLSNKENLDQESAATAWRNFLPEQQGEIVIGAPKTSSVSVEINASFKAFFTVLKEKAPLSSFVFHSTIFTEEAFRELINYFAIFSVQGLCFFNCQLSPKMITALKNLKNLLELTISGNSDIHEKREFCLSINEVTTALPDLVALSLEYDLLTDQDLPLLFPRGIPKGLKWLFLKGNSITNEGKNLMEKWLAPTSPGHKRSDEASATLPCLIDLHANPVLRYDL